MNFDGKKITLEAFPASHIHYTAWTNTDLTEGRGAQYPIAVCKLAATARRLAKGKGVMGTNAEILETHLYLINGVWYGPVSINHGTDADEREEAKYLAQRRAYEKAKAAGLTDEEIEALRA